MLNAHGREMLPQAEELVAMAERMASAGGAGHVSGSLRIGAIASVQQDLLVRALGLFRAQYPDVRVRIVPGVSLSLLGQVDAGEVDLAVLIRPPFALPPELGWQPLLSEPVALAVPAAMPEAPWRELLATQPFIRYDRASFGGRVVDLFLKKHRIRVHEAVELDEIEAIANMVRHGLGVALLVAPPGHDGPASAAAGRGRVPARDRPDRAVAVRTRQHARQDRRMPAGGRRRTPIPAAKKSAPDGALA